MATAIDVPPLTTLHEEQRALRAQLARLRRRLRLQLALEFVCDTATLLAAAAALLVFFDWCFRIGVTTRLILLVSTLVGILAYLGIRVIRVRRAARLDELSLAMVLDRYLPGTGQQIADVLQLPDLLSEPSSASPPMVRLAVKRACEALAHSDWRSLWNRGRTATHFALLLGALLVPAMFALCTPQVARLSFARWLLGSAERWPQSTYLTVSGLKDNGHLVAPRDERFVLEVRSGLSSLEPRSGKWVLWGRGEPLILRRKPLWTVNPSEVRVSERTSEGKTIRAVMSKTGPALFSLELPPSSTSSSVSLAGGDDWLGPLTIERVDRPSLASVQLRVKEPGSPGNAFRNVDDPRQHLLFLPDTEIQFTLVGSESLADALLKVQPGEAPSLKRVDGHTFATQWTLREATTLEIVLTSEQTGLASKPVFLSIGLMKDREPRVTLRAVGVGTHVTAIATIPLTVAATDDRGLASLRLQADRTTVSDDKSEPKTERKTVSLSLPDDQSRPLLDHLVRHDVLLQSEPPQVGTVLRFQGEAQDRCARGAQTGRSSVLQFHVVSPDEMFYEILVRQRAERAKFLAALETVEKQTPVLDSKPGSEDYLRALRVHHAASRQLDQIASRITDTLQEMKLNQVGSPKSHRLLQEGIIDPIRTLNTGQAKELRNMLQSLASMGAPSQANREAAGRLQHEVVTKMHNILDQMSQWESFVDVVNHVAEVIKMQQKVLQATEKARETRTREVFDEKP